MQITRTLRRGSSGRDVFFLQELLLEMSLFTGTPDGFFGATTEQAVRAFQRARGLRVDGIVGPQTRAALLSKPTPTPVPTAVWQLVELLPTAEATLARGVAAVNLSLGQLHVLAENLPPPEIFGTRFVGYRAWLVTAERHPLVSIRLENCPGTETWISSGGVTTPVHHATAVIVTAEPDMVTVPTGSEVLGGLLAAAMPVTDVALEPTTIARGATGFGFINLQHGIFLVFTSGMPDPAAFGTDPGVGRVLNAFGTALVETLTSTRIFLGQLQHCLPGVWVGLFRFEPVAADVVEVFAMVAGHLPPTVPVVILRGVIAIPKKPLG
ncbi:MAG: peptidoglycan-binding domain-containing protein [Bacillota bacterium]